MDFPNTDRPSLPSRSGGLSSLLGCILPGMSDDLNQVMTRDEMIAGFREALQRENITWTQLRDSMYDCGCCSELGGRAAELWWLIGLRDFPELG